MQPLLQVQPLLQACRHRVLPEVLPWASSRVLPKVGHRALSRGAAGKCPNWSQPRLAGLPGRQRQLLTAAHFYRHYHRRLRCLSKSQAARLSQRHFATYHASRVQLASANFISASSAGNSKAQFHFCSKHQHFCNFNAKCFLNHKRMHASQSGPSVGNPNWQEPVAIWFAKNGTTVRAGRVAVAGAYKQRYAIQHASKPASKPARKPAVACHEPRRSHHVPKTLRPEPLKTVVQPPLTSTSAAASSLETTMALKCHLPAPGGSIPQSKRRR